MKTLLAAALVLFGAFFWKRDAAPAHDWPDALPAFAGARPEFSCTPSADGAVASFTTALDPDAALESARAAYAAAGWREEPVRAADMLVFTTPEKVSAVLAQPLAHGGSRVTAIARRR